jgi:alpha-beta hydrolase superfamily lysophospholipase
LLSGHSTGGLLAAVWLSQRPGGADGLFLNGPFFASGVPLAVQAALNPVLGFVADWRPATAFPGKTVGVYAKNLHSEFGGEWTFDLSWKSASGTRMRFGWLAGVHEGQRAVRRGLRIGVPVLVLYGDRDVVLSVGLNAALAPRLGRAVTCERIPGALHDVFLSGRPVREDAFGILGKWLDSAGLG